MSDSTRWVPTEAQIERLLIDTRTRRARTGAAESESVGPQSKAKHGLQSQDRDPYRALCLFQSRHTKVDRTNSP